jgi:Citrate lyase beta subunit
MQVVILFVGLLLAVSVLTLLGKYRSRAAVAAIFVGAGIIAVLSLLLGSTVFVGSDSVGLVKKNALGPALSGGRIIATGGEMGVQARTLPPGWHFGYWPVIYEVETEKLVEVPAGKVGLVEARDGTPLASGQLFAPEVDPAEFKKMIDDAAYFLSSGGHKGTQSNVLTPGKYRLNPALFSVELVDATDVPNASVAVLKANFGTAPSLTTAVGDGGESVRLAGEGEKGVRAEFLPPGKYPVNTRAFEVTTVSTKETILRFTAGQRMTENRAATNATVGSEEREILVRTSDGFTFPVDVRIEYKIEPPDAPVVVALLGSDGDPLLSKMNSTVRAIFRNNAENVKALDYVNQRSQQEKQSLTMLQAEMARVGVTVLAVRIGDVGNEETLGELLTTQRDREIAVQQQLTYQRQQDAAEQKKQLTRAEQESEEERRLATARYEVQIAEQDQAKRLLQAEAEAKATLIQAQARADAYKLIASQIGPANAAFNPTKAELDHAQAVVAAFDSPEAQDKGAIELQGAMVERLHLEAAKRLLALNGS